MKTTTRVTTAAAAIALCFALPAASAVAADRNDDGIPDRWEKRYDLSLEKNQAKRDQDRDDLSNLGEFRNRTHPRHGDTDDDGLGDGAEVSSGHDPNDDDSDDDGTVDGAEIFGAVKRFDAASGVLVISTANRDVSGVVTAATKIKCDDSRRSGDDDPPGDDSGGHGSDDGPGDDNGGDSTTTVCTAADLVPGARVHGAELAADGSWHEVELAR